MRVACRWDCRPPNPKSIGVATASTKVLLDRPDMVEGPLQSHINVTTLTVRVLRLMLNGPSYGLSTL